MCDGWTRPGKVYIFDGVDAGDADTMHQRVALCYAWAEQHGLAVLDEIICWAPRHNPDRGQALDLAVAACRRDRAACWCTPTPSFPPTATPWRASTRYHCGA